MSSSSNNSLTTAVNDIRQAMIICIQICNICQFIFGAVGHALNIYIFTRPKFYRNPCVRYFLASTVSGYGVVCFTLPLRLLQVSFNIDVFISSVPMCKILTYILPCFRVLPSWFVMLASVDRSSSATLRTWSNNRIASRAILFTTVFISVAYVHLLFYQTIALLPQPTCAVLSNTYQTFYALWNLIFWSWIPTGCMLFFGLLIIQNIRQGKMRVVPQNQLQRNQKKTDRQLIQMLLFQSFLLGSTTMAFSIGSLYVSVTNSLRVKNDLDKIKDTFLVNILNCVANTGACMSFYIFTLSSQLFRRQLTKLFHSLFRTN